MRSLRLVSGLAALTLAGTLGLAACGSSQESTPASDATMADGQMADDEAMADDGEAAFTEYPIGEDQEISSGGTPQINVALVYFQPVDMEPAGSSGLAASESSFHIEADISALPSNTLGYPEGSFIPGLTVTYKIVDAATGEVANNGAAEGTFMQMNASDGPHYGANVALPQDGTYNIMIGVSSPEEAGWVLHVDPETGVTGSFWEATELTWKNWEYTVQEW
ncbi:MULTISPECIES: iron transporter [unclassified Actinomyces]|uniref:iron transporter n=1 Tax=unclassified Actinomyces TaxID=2609248 RepID=UPI002017B345|nr:MULTISPECIES: iron transporter [unclassified Actinomyces]MCL3776698.1 iron transporter [Actinomyces sp. AC-20-1]MCL3790621.1 iron transporter [Actinomyces sp. 187325]MCL3792938.1 iron transporter [Actinomyces sp. 186855]MCL3795351.1 iron transporter [Actinomyces sp. 217892]